MMKRLLFGLTTVALLAAPFGSARAFLVLSAVQDQTAYGFGTVQTLMSLQAQAQNQTEQGCRAWQPAGNDPVLGAFQNDFLSGPTPWQGNVVNGGNFCAEGSANDVPPGTPKTALPTLGDASITSTAEIGVLFNSNQISDAGITLNALVLSFYTATGDVIFSATLAPNFCSTAAICSGSNTFAFTEQGQGSAGFLFILDAAQQAALLAAMGGTFNPNIFVGASASAGCAGTTANCKEASDGAESISLIRTATTTTVPEPSSAALVATGLIGLARFARRRRRQS